VADALVDGSSYGAERRFCLRTPTVLLAGPAPLASVVVAGSVAGAPLLLAAGQWVAGAVVAAIAIVAVRVLVPAVHQLARRWIVLVPAGLVVHDPLVMTDAVLLPRRMIASLAPAPATVEGRATDLTGGAAGLALELRLKEPVTVVPRWPRRAAAPVHTDDLLFTPRRPGAVVSAMAP
jgi:hypothetical protein